MKNKKAPSLLEITEDYTAYRNATFMICPRCSALVSHTCKSGDIEESKLLPQRLKKRKGIINEKHS